MIDDVCLWLDCMLLPGGDYTYMYQGLHVFFTDHFHSTDRVTQYNCEPNAHSNVKQYCEKERMLGCPSTKHLFVELPKAFEVCL